MQGLPLGIGSRGTMSWAVTANCVIYKNRKEHKWPLRKAGQSGLELPFPPLTFISSKFDRMH